MRVIMDACPMPPDQHPSAAWCAHDSETPGYAHVHPLRDLVEHTFDPDGDCVCGPTPDRVDTAAGDGWVLIHHSLDGRERAEP